MKNKVLNFDRFVEEKKESTITVNAKGISFTIRAVVPAIVPVMLARAAEGGLDESASVMMMFRAADLMLGKENVDALCAKGMTSPELYSLIQHTFALINGKEDEDDGSEEVMDNGGLVEKEERPNA